MTNKQIHKMRVVLILSIIAWMVIIFLFSMQNINQSTALSTKVMYVIAKLIQPFTHIDTKEYIYYHFSELTWWIRKCAHVFVFLVLTTLIGLLLTTFPALSPGKASILTVCIGFICALIDEGHQLLIAGRSGNFFDIGIDMIGVILGIIIALCLYDLFINKR